MDAVLDHQVVLGTIQMAFWSWSFQRAQTWYSGLREFALKTTKVRAIEIIKLGQVKGQ